MACGMRETALLGVALGLYACGGGGGGGGSGSGGGGSQTIAWQQGIYQPSSNFEARCASPRSGSSAVTGRPFPDRPGLLLEETHWLRSWTHELYLWYSEVPDLNPANYTSTQEYFDLQKTSALTASGRPQDRFHFTFPTAEWEALSLGGEEVGYGLRWEIIQGTSTTPPRVWIAYLEPGTQWPAAQAGLTRGGEVLAVDGFNVDSITTQEQADTVNGGLFPSAAGQSHTFRIRERGGNQILVTIQSVSVTSAPVHKVLTVTDAMGKVGYFQFNDHLATAESALIDAVRTLEQQNVTDLVVDIRYNGGGFLDIASELAYMIAGAGPTAGRAFERLIFSDKHPTTNPVTGEALQPTPFHNTTQGITPGLSAGQPLPALDLMRVFVLTGPGTCSASESVINGLLGVDVQVIQIGSTTCGKPYGFYPWDNCGTTYFSIQFKGANAKDFGDYADGFSPFNATGTGGERVTGCAVADDFSRELGDPAEARFAAALAYRVNQSCPAPSGVAPADRAQPQSAPGPWPALKIGSPARNNRILRP